MGKKIEENFRLKLRYFSFFSLLLLFFSFLRPHFFIVMNADEVELSDVAK